MKIGFSFGRCIDDILNNRVEYSDVLLIVARTRLPSIEDIRPVVAYYVDDGYINGDLEEAVRIGEKLYRDGKLHQPRMFDAPTTHVDNSGVWMDLAPTAHSSEPVQKAWKQYQTLLRLTEDEKPMEPNHIQRVKALYSEKKIDDNQNPPFDDNF